MNDFKQLFLSERPLLDVRAPVEFAKGAFPTSVNIPILTDEQRHQVGICYEEEGPEAAEALGHSLVSSDKASLISSWTAFIEANPNALLYCFRGGKRSQIAQAWLAETGVDIERVPGGYKALRQYLLQQLESPPTVILLSGKTGVGKTELLPSITSSVDLEGLANHRGSAFGGKATPQPAQIDFENALAIEFLRHPEIVVLEDESRLIGKIHLPLELQTAMKQAPIVLLEDTLENRVSRIFTEYVEEPLHYVDLNVLQDNLVGSVNAIKNRLGGVRHQELVDMMNNAFSAHSRGNHELHRAWIETLLTEYYDPMYQYQLDKKRIRIQSTIHWREIIADTRLNFSAYAV